MYIVQFWSYIVPSVLYKTFWPVAHCALSTLGLGQKYSVHIVQPRQYISDLISA